MRGAVSMALAYTQVNIRLILVLLDKCTGFLLGNAKIPAE